MLRAHDATVSYLYLESYALYSSMRRQFGQRYYIYITYNAQEISAVHKRTALGMYCSFKTILDEGPDTNRHFNRQNDIFDGPGSFFDRDMYNVGGGVDSA